MKENVTVNVRVVEENRPSIASFGGLYGHRIFCATKIATNLNFNEQSREARDNNGLTTNRTPYRYKVTAIDIVGLDLDKDIDGSNVIVINKGRVDAAGESIEVRCPIDNEKFTKDVTTDTVTEALNRSNGTKIYFANGKKLAEAIRPANMNEMNRIDNLIADLKKQRELIERTDEQNVSGVTAYYAQLDGKKPSVNVTVEVD